MDNCLSSLYTLTLWWSGKHGCGWEGAAPESDVTRRWTQRPMRLTECRCCVWVFFFFFFLGFTPNWADSARIGPYWPATEMAKTDRNGQNRLKLALNLAGTAEILILECFLPSSFFVLWIKDSNVFFNNILIVKIYRKYK